MELYIFIPLCIILFFMSWSDLKTKTIPHSLTIGLLILGLINAFINPYFKSLNWIIFGVFSVIFILTFYLFDKLGKPIGGGDIKLICISFLFLSYVSQYMTYFMALCVFNIWAIIIGILNKGKSFYNSSIKYGPYLSLALISATTLYCVVDITICLFIVFSFMITFLFMEIYYHTKEVLLDVQLF